MYWEEPFTDTSTHYRAALQVTQCCTAPFLFVAVVKKESYVVRTGLELTTWWDYRFAPTRAVCSTGDRTEGFFGYTVVLCPCEAGARGLEGGMEMQVQKQLRRKHRGFKEVW